eukprot:CAMPEP_0194071144 /NCGR_PEP_ID=MMETSP0009_2-20130614/88552_1 /TAXON_ID=210454 /ORGANISM="Grammatophora oceanica, Strain CCMP 410" /LENGTH=161 /DNA_ID=CAMNT_0038724449 /DNA_START=363 /DNA_END=848 /DNA_ORIENTATION=-
MPGLVKYATRSTAGWMDLDGSCARLLYWGTCYPSSLVGTYGCNMWMDHVLAFCVGERAILRPWWGPMVVTIDLENLEEVVPAKELGDDFIADVESFVVKGLEKQVGAWRRILPFETSRGDYDQYAHILPSPCRTPKDVPSHGPATKVGKRCLGLKKQQTRR